MLIFVRFKEGVEAYELKIEFLYALWFRLDDIHTRTSLELLNCWHYLNSIFKQAVEIFVV